MPARIMRMAVLRFMSGCGNRRHAVLKGLKLLFFSTLGFELDGCMLDIEALFERVFDVVEDLMKVLAVCHNGVRAQRKDIGSNCPDMKIMNFADAIDGFDGKTYFFESNALRYRLHEHAQRVFHQAPRRKEN